MQIRLACVGMSHAICYGGVISGTRADDANFIANAAPMKQNFGINYALQLADTKNQVLNG